MGPRPSRPHECFLQGTPFPCWSFWGCFSLPSLHTALPRPRVRASILQLSDDAHPERRPVCTRCPSLGRGAWACLPKVPTSSSHPVRGFSPGLPPRWLEPRFWVSETLSATSHTRSTCGLTPARPPPPRSRSGWGPLRPLGVCLCCHVAHRGGAWPLHSTGGHRLPLRTPEACAGRPRPACPGRCPPQGDTDN